MHEMNYVMHAHTHTRDALQIAVIVNGLDLQQRKTVCVCVCGFGGVDEMHPELAPRWENKEQIYQALVSNNN